MFRTDFVFAGFTRLLVGFATLRVGCLAAIGRRHFLLNALAEGWALLALAFLVSHFACFALLRVHRFAAIKVLALINHALFTLRADLAFTGFIGFGACFAVRVAGFRVLGL